MREFGDDSPGHPPRYDRRSKESALIPKTRRRTPARSALFACAALSTAGCATIGHYQTAETAGKGNIEFGVEPSYYSRSLGLEEDVVLPEVNGTRAVVIDGQDLNEALGLEQGVPNLCGSLRYGLADNVDVGLRWGTNGLDVLGKIQVTPTDKEDLVVSVLPSLGGLVVPSGDGNIGVLSSQLGVLVGMRIGEDGQVVFGPKLQDWHAQGSAQDVDVTGHYLAVGGSAGVAFHVTKGIRLLPEVAFMSPVLWKIHAVAEQGVFESTALPEGQHLLLQAGVGVLLAKPKK